MMNVFSPKALHDLWNYCCGVIPMLYLCSCASVALDQSKPHQLTKHFTEWPKASVEKLLGTFMKSKSFQSSKTLDGKIRYDREGSNWDHFRYGSFLEPTAWIRVSSRVSSDPKNNISTLHIEISVVTERISSLEEEHPPRPQHIEAVESLLGEFEAFMLRPASGEGI